MRCQEFQEVQRGKIRQRVGSKQLTHHSSVETSQNEKNKSLANYHLYECVCYMLIRCCYTEIAL